MSLSDGYQQGINWSEILANSGSTDFQFSTTSGSLGDAISATLGGVTSLSFVNKDFSGVLNLLQTQGNVQVLSSPRVTAINNQKAVIKVGDDEYFVTDVSSESTVTAATASTTPNIELTPFFSGIALDVTPQIDAQGGVLLHVHPSVIETEEQEKVVTLNEEQFVLPLAASNIRESDTYKRLTGTQGIQFHFNQSLWVPSHNVIKTLPVKLPFEAFNARKIMLNIKVTSS